MKKSIALILICFILCFLVAELSDNQYACAAEKNEFPFISIETYNVTKDKIIPGSDFILTLYLRNNSTTTSAKNVVVGITCPAGVSPKYGTPGQIYFKEIPKGEIVETKLEFSTLEEIYSYYLDFQVTIFCDESNNSLVLRIPVGTESPFNITNVSIDENGIEGESASASIAFKVIGIDYVKNVTIKALLDNNEVSAISIGALAPGTSKTQLISIPLFSFGTHEIKLSITYEDALGKTGVLEVGTQSIEVIRKAYEPTPTPIVTEPGVLDKLKNNSKMLVGSTGAILIICVSLFIILIKLKGKR